MVGWSLIKSNMRKTIAVIQGDSVILNDDGSVEYDSKGAVDGDGSGGNQWSDPDFQPATSLKENGISLNAEEVPYVVVPPEIIEDVKGIVLGCHALVTYKGKSIEAVVGDVGPHTKLGEFSIALFKAFGINDSPLDGGVDSGMHTRIWPGMPAWVNGKQYNLQASK